MIHYDRLVRETEADATSFRSIPIIRHTLENGISSHIYLEFLSEAYHHVRHTCPLLGAALARCASEDEAYRSALLTYLDDEKGHEEWILDDIRAIGGDADAVKFGHGSHATRVMVGYAYYAIDRVSPYSMLGMVHVLEGMSQALAAQAAAMIRSTLPMSQSQGGFSYLTSHGLIDQDHVRLFAALLEKIQSPPIHDEIIRAAKDFYVLYGNIFRDLGHRNGVRNDR